MKKLVLTSIATLAVAVGAFAQGIINLDNSTTAYGVTTGGSSFYSGPFGMQIWELSGATAVPSGINGAGPAAAYAALGTDSFKSEGIVSGTMSGGAFSLGNFTMADVTPPGSQVVLGLAVWNSTAASWAANAALSGTPMGGVIAFLNPTVAPVTSGPPPVGADMNGPWTTAGQNLVMGAVTTIPEPGTLALAGLGVAALLIFRRRK
jgi:hypothetical protein